MIFSLVRIALPNGGSARLLRGPLFAALLTNLAENGKYLTLRFVIIDPFIMNYYRTSSVQKRSVKECRS